MRELIRVEQIRHRDASRFTSAPHQHIGRLVARGRARRAGRYGCAHPRGRLRLGGPDGPAAHGRLVSFAIQGTARKPSSDSSSHATGTDSGTCSGNTDSAPPPALRALRQRVGARRARAVGAVVVRRLQALEVEVQVAHRSLRGGALRIDGNRKEGKIVRMAALARCDLEVPDARRGGVLPRRAR